METEEKMRLICSLLKEVSIEFKDKANKIKEFDDALCRMLIEDGEYYFHQIYKKIYISGDIDSFITRLKYADKLLVEHKVN